MEKLVSEEFEKKFMSADFSAMVRDRQSHPAGSSSRELPFKVCVDDNFHYMDESERTTHGTFATLDEAVAACKRIVDSYLMGAHKPGIRAQELYESYTMFGDDPFILSEFGDGGFSAWHYAKERCGELCR